MNLIFSWNSSAGISSFSIEELYQFEAGTYYIEYSSDGSYNGNTPYYINLNKISNITDDANSFVTWLISQ